MELTVTNEAKEYMEKFQKEDEKWLIVYEKVGCTCSEEGVFALRLVHHVPSRVVTFETSVGPIYVSEDRVVYMDKKMTIRYNDTYHDLELVGAFDGMMASHFIIENEDGSQRHL